MSVREDTGDDTWRIILVREMSPFERYLRERLGKKNSSWVKEWDTCTEAVRSVLAELRGKDGDDQFVLFVLANYRWRQVVPFGPLRERDSLIKQIDQLLGNQSSWFQYVQQSGRDSWKAAEEALRHAKSCLLSIRSHDMSVFEATHTEWTTEGPRWASDHSYTCLWVLDWYLKQMPGVRRIKRRLLGELLLPFGFLGRSRNTVLLVAQRLRRNPRVRKGNRFIRNWNLAHLIRMYHQLHKEAGAQCGPLCAARQDILAFKPPIKADRLIEKAWALERSNRHAPAARCYQAALADAEQILGMDHPYLAWIWVRYWLALRAGGQHAKAAKIKARADAMWAKHGAGHLSR